MVGCMVGRQMCNVARLLSKKNPQGLTDFVAKGHCKGGWGCRRGMCSLLHEAVETKISPFSNQNIDSENHLSVSYLHEIEGHYFEIKDSNKQKNPQNST